MTKLEKKLKKLTTRDRRIVLEALEPGGSWKEVITREYNYDPSDKAYRQKVSQVKCRILDRLGGLGDVLQAAGLGDDFIASKIHELCGASDPVVYEGKLTGAERPNWSARGRGLEILTNIRGVKQGANQRDIMTQMNNVLNIKVESVDQAKETIDMLKSQYSAEEYDPNKRELEEIEY